MVLGGGGVAGRFWSCFGVSIQRGLSAWAWEGLGLAGAFITWEVTSMDTDSNIKYDIMFVLLFHEIVSKTKA